jgi:hypothetical protein
MFVLCELKGISWFRAAAVISTALLLALGAQVSSATAGPLGDCFERVAVAFHHPSRPRPHVTHHPVAHRPAIHRIHAAGSRPRAGYNHAYVLRPRACGGRRALATPIGGLTSPSPAQTLLAELAGPGSPPPEARAVSQPLPAGSEPSTVGGPPPTDTPAPGGFGFPGVPLGGPGTTGTPGTPGPPSVSPPATEPPPNPPPISPPAPPPGPPTIEPPTQPPVLPPGQPPIFPPDGPPTIVSPPGGPGPIPEPDTWTLLVLGFGAVGWLLRRRAVPKTASQSTEIRLTVRRRPR